AFSGASRGRQPPEVHPPGADAPGSPEPSPLGNRQRALVQLHQRQVDRGRVDRADAEAAGAGPARVGVLRGLPRVAHGLPVLAPDDALARRRVAVELLPAALAQDVDGLGVVIMRVLVVADADALRPAQAHRDRLLAVPEPLLAEVVLVLAGAEQAGDGRRRDGRALHALVEAVVDAAALAGARLQVVVGLLDDGLGDGDAGVARRPQ